MRKASIPRLQITLQRTTYATQIGHDVVGLSQGLKHEATIICDLSKERDA